MRRVVIMLSPLAVFALVSAAMLSGFTIATWIGMGGRLIDAPVAQLICAIVLAWFAFDDSREPFRGNGGRWKRSGSLWVLEVPEKEGFETVSDDGEKP